MKQPTLLFIGYVLFFCLLCVYVLFVWVSRYFYRKQVESKMPLVESFTEKTSIVLLGDSIVKNDEYVSSGKSVEDILFERTNQVYSFAKNNTTILTVYSQIQRIPKRLNSANTTIFISLGGNDILSHYVDQNQDIHSHRALSPMFSAYKHAIQRLQQTMPHAQLVLLDIYYPTNMQYKQFHTIIQQWNHMVYQFGAQHNYQILRISQHLTDPSDFTFNIEPSSSGGEKIAKLILETV